MAVSVRMGLHVVAVVVPVDDALDEEEEQDAAERAPRHGPAEAALVLHRLGQQVEERVAEQRARADGDEERHDAAHARGTERQRHRAHEGQDGDDDDGGEGGKGRFVHGGDVYTGTAGCG